MPSRATRPSAEADRRQSIRAWTCYAAIGYVAVTVTVVGLTLDQLAQLVGVRGGVELRQIFLGRGVGAVVGTLVSGWMLDRFPVKRVVTLFSVSSALFLAAVPAARTVPALVCLFFAVGLSGSALVVCATTSACWAFPGASVGPVMSAAAASFGVSSALLPLLLRPFAASLRAQYTLSSGCAIPALLLLALSTAPTRPPRLSALPRGVVEAGGLEGGPGRPPPAGAAAELGCAPHGGSGGCCRCRRSTALTLSAGVVQVLLQGGLSSLMGWIVSFGRMHWDEADSASALISALQGASTVGCVAAAHFQKRCDLLVLLPAQLAVATAGMLAAIALTSSGSAGFVAIGWYGFFAGPTVAYCSSLLNTHVRLTGFRMGVVSVGINVGANLVPWGVGCLMSAFGPLALVLSICAANTLLVVALGGAAAWTCLARRREPAGGVEPLLGAKEAHRGCD
ncbi:hypothetical protein KFE25_009847 [Diacronema lutheri]|uniref:Uncharacterized protein n=1 Tax=Diacronema lutheri TaxID=2081491 RepID=A0A8J6BZK0_DIALT|nr:hypothetical protein KFE25_009847 [Diacronema lutheri]